MSTLSPALCPKVPSKICDTGTTLGAADTGTTSTSWYLVSSGRSSSAEAAARRSSDGGNMKVVAGTSASAVRRADSARP
ncbi:hypothetical protein [Pseudarthrobacter sp. NamB4]|uniref:hypothetical protein n=1 Tax=Pseudarthrobacter sp. NamB4 TaxID=2576837 RepID=UPI001F1042D9|nr:hypothetical protein [Pseudarthrobacter sp. NamB4]